MTDRQLNQGAQEFIVQLDQLAAMGTEPVTIDDSEAIEASFKLLEPEPE